MVEERGRAVFDKSSEDPPCLVFEWMGSTLRYLPPEPYRGRSVLPKAIARSVLNALDLFASANEMHAGQLYLYEVTLEVLTTLGVSLRSIHLSDIDDASPVVKLGGLGHSV